MLDGVRKVTLRITDLERKKNRENKGDWPEEGSCLSDQPRTPLDVARKGGRDGEILA